MNFDFKHKSSHSAANNKSGCRGPYHFDSTGESSSGDSHHPLNGNRTAPRRPLLLWIQGHSVIPRARFFSSCEDFRIAKSYSPQRRKERKDYAKELSLELSREISWEKASFGETEKATSAELHEFHECRMSQYFWFLCHSCNS